MIVEELTDSNLAIAKLFDFSSDGPNINESLWGSWATGNWLNGGHGLLDHITCTLHVIHNSLRKGLNVYGEEAEQLAIVLLVQKCPLQARRLPDA